MRIRPPKAQARRGFTLIELMVVIAIIGVLVSLLMAGVMRAIIVANQTKNQHEISQLAISLEGFKTKYGFYPPSRLQLCKTQGGYGSSQLEVDSQAYILQMFPNIGTTWSSTGIQWDGGSGAGPWTLEGDQCLVFFLGGIPIPGTPPGTNGFSSDPSNPTNFSSGVSKISFYEFQSGRLKDVHGNGFYSYLDTYTTGQPYVYFSAYKQDNNYNRYGSSDSSLGVQPYFEASNRYLKPNSFQIISAGRDGKFGQGGQWTPSTAGSTSAAYQSGSSTVKAGLDDQSNFYGSLLGNTP